MKSRDKIFNSIRFKLVFGVSSILLPLIILLIYGNSYAITILHNQVAETNRNLLALYMEQIDAGLAVAEKYLVGSVSDPSLRTAFAKADADRYTLLKVALTDRLAKDMISYQTVDAMFYFNSDRQDLIYAAFPNRSAIAERDAVTSYLVQFLSIKPALIDKSFRKWVVFRIGSDNYIFRIFKNGPDYQGAWVNLKNLLIPLNKINLGSGGLVTYTSMHGVQLASSRAMDDDHLLLSGQADRYYLTGDSNQYLVVGAASSSGNFVLNAIIPDSQILSNLIWLRRIITAIAILSVMVLPVSLIYLRQIILVPLGQLQSAMKKIQAGDIETRTSMTQAAEEFSIVSDTFNSMLDQIHDLKINIYEEKLARQRQELDHLKLQVNPHFFLNSLNMLYRFQQSKKIAPALEMTRCLLDYFRYTFRNRSDFVTLHDELALVRNYLKIHELRYPDLLACQITVDDLLVQMPVPPMIIQNFAENTIKYALTLESPVSLSIVARLTDTGRDRLPRAEIIIADTGPGFPAEVLESLQAGGQPGSDPDDSKIGIHNVRRRLELIYQGNADIIIANQAPHGAVIKMCLPIRTAGRL